MVCFLVAKMSFNKYGIIINCIIEKQIGVLFVNQSRMYFILLLTK